jgi:hypothetical protein
LLLATVYFASSCEKNDDTAGSAPGQVTNIEHQPDFGTIVFTWTRPADSSYYYTDIRYEVNGVEYSKKATKYKDSTTVEGLISDAPVDFRFYSVSTTGAYSEPVVYRASCQTPPFDLVLQTVDVVLDSTDLFGVFVRWTNETGKKVTIDVSYINKSGSLALNSFSATESGEALISNIVSGDAKKVTVKVRDAKQNVSDEREFTLDIITTTYIDRKAWTFPGYDSESRYETIGYSSQALNESSSDYPNNGSVVAMFDGDADTFWHAAWSSPSTNYPHWFIVDMGEELSITHVEMTRRKGDSRGQTGFQLFTCTTDGATDVNDPTVWQWQNQGKFEFNSKINDAQKYRLTDSPRARYLKVYMDETCKGTGGQAMIAEFGAYAMF